MYDLAYKILHEDGCLLGCSTLMMEALQASEALVNSYQSTRRYNPEDSHLHSHRREDLKSQNSTCLAPVIIGIKQSAEPRSVQSQCCIIFYKILP
jgi:hypothetical protein